jgi:RNA polymerase sigma factor (sigma-70 family)
MLASSLPGRFGEHASQHRLVIFPPKITRSRKAKSRLERSGSLPSSPVRGRESWKLFHEGQCLGADSIDGQIPVSFDEPGLKALEARVECSPSGLVYRVQSQLLVVPSEEEELALLVEHGLQEESEQWFDQMMSRRQGEVDWRSGFDLILRKHMIRLPAAQAPFTSVEANHRARFLAVRLHEKLIRTIARQYFGRDQAAIDEAVHVVYVQFVTGQGNFDPSRDCGSYLRSIVAHYCERETRRKGRERTMDGSQLSDLLLIQPASVSFQEEFEKLLAEAIDEGSLSATEADIVRERFSNDLSYPKIAEMFELTSSPDYQARSAAGQRCLARIVGKLKRHMGLGNDRKEGKL